MALNYKQEEEKLIFERDTVDRSRLSVIGQEFQSQDSRISKAHPALSVDFSAISCSICWRIPLINKSARECPSCHKLFCISCVQEWHEQNNGREECKNCRSKTPLTNILSEQLKKTYEQIRVTCINEDLGCDEVLKVDATLADHAQNCLYQCRQCKNMIPKKRHQAHILECKAPLENIQEERKEAVVVRNQLHEDDDGQSVDLSANDSKHFEVHSNEFAGEGNQEYAQEENRQEQQNEYSKSERPQMLPLIDKEKLDRSDLLKFELLADHLRVQQQANQIKQQTIKNAEEELIDVKDQIKSGDKTLHFYYAVIAALLFVLVFVLFESSHLRQLVQNQGKNLSMN